MFCNLKPTKTDYYIHENDDFNNSDIDQTVLIQTDFFEKLPILNWKKEHRQGTSCDELYPYVNSYYSYTENSDALNKVSSLLAQPELLEANRQKERIELKYDQDAYSEKEAQCRYLESKPLSFIILGKPSLDQRELGKQLTEYWGSVYVEPQSLIEAEIESDSRAGQCIEFNLRCGRAIGADIILKLVQQKVKSESAKHRGFVLCDLPVIHNDLFEEDPVSSQSAIFTAKDIFEEIFTVTTDMCFGPSNPQVSISSNYQSEVDSTKDTSRSQSASVVDIRSEARDESQLYEDNIGKKYDKQLEYLFDLLDGPYLIIYIQGANIDVLAKRDLYRFNIKTNELIDLQRRMYNHVFKEMIMEEEDNEELNEEMLDLNTLRSEDFRLSHLVKLPADFNANISTQLDRYHYVALHCIQNRVLAHRPEYYVKLDGRTSISKMLSTVKAKLSIMNVQRAIIPRNLKIFNDNLYNEPMNPEDGSPELEEANLPLKQYGFNQLKSLQVANKNFLWSLSEWGTKCPVSMKMGFIREGKVKHSLQFLNKLFFFANEEAYWKFYCNPRPFLLPPFPRPTCKIFVFGPKRSGRTALSNCLAYYWGGTVISFGKLMNDFMQHCRDEYLEKVRQQAIAEGIVLLNQIRAEEAAEKEKLRITQIQDWVRTILDYLEQMKTLLSEMEKEGKQEKFEISSFPMAMKSLRRETQEESEYVVGVLQLREQLTELNLPINNIDTKVWKTFLHDRRKLLAYLPRELAQKFQPQPAKVFDDFVQEYVQNALLRAGGKSTKISGGGFEQIFIKHITAAENRYEKLGYGRGGWIIDGILCDLPMLQELDPLYCADDIIVLKDNGEFLSQKFSDRESTHFQEYRKFFMDAGMLEPAWRTPTVVSTREYQEGVVRSILEDILDSDIFDDNPDSVDEEHPKISRRLETYNMQLETFNLDWQRVHEYYKTKGVSPIEIDVTGKSLPELFLTTIMELEAKYSYEASQLTEEDRVEEELHLKPEGETVDDLASPLSDSVEGIVEPIRRYGDTWHFCPVSLEEDFVLWKGKEEFAVNYNNNIYLLATNQNMKKFIKEPKKYLLSGYSTKLPPPRICVIGVSGTGKTYVSMHLSMNYGRSYLSFEDILKKAYKIKSNDSLAEIGTKFPGSEIGMYLNGQVPLRLDVVHALRSYWFDEPFKSKGLVFDDFPKTQLDVDVMIENKLIPDLILCLEADAKYLKSKFTEGIVEKWQMTMDQQRKESDDRYGRAVRRWGVQRSERFNMLIEDRREKRYNRKLSAKHKSPETDDESSVGKTASLISVDSIADQHDIDEVNKILDKEFPPIIYEPPIYDREMFIAQLEPVISQKVDTDLVLIGGIKSKCLSEQISIENLPLNLDHMENNVLASYLIVEPINFRTRSFIERCYDVSVAEAEKLLESGYVFLSKFGRTCPVQYYDNKIPIQMYELAKESYNLFPIVHRSYIYFIIGNQQRNMFVHNILKYIEQEFNMPLLNYKIAAIGPPKCGKTTLSERIQREFKFLLISRGKAVRYVLKYLFESELAKSMEAVLRKGWELTDEMVIRSVEAISFNHFAITRGIIFDGFPNSLNECRHLAYLDLLPNLVIDLEADRQQTVDCLDSDKLHFPKFSIKFILHRYEEWKKDSTKFRMWFDSEYQAMTTFPIKNSIWWIWKQSKEFINSTLFEINHYHKHIGEDWPLRLGNMLVTPLEFLNRQSYYKTYCPVCLHFTKSLVDGGNPPDRSGLVQYRNYFYWICNDHIEIFLKSPDQYLPPYNQQKMPASIPQKVTFDRKPDNLYEDGVCAVCYKHKHIVTIGQLSICCIFNDKVYMFDTVDCQNVFLKNPTTFMFRIEFHAPVYPDLTYTQLPVLGMLEQYLAKYIVAAVSYLAKRRPIIPGLSISTSALIGLGLHLKLMNKKPEHLQRYYEEGFRVFNKRRLNLLKYLEFMKNHRNPYLFYKEPLPPFKLPDPTPKPQSLTTMVSRIVDECVDNMDIFMKTSEESSEA